MSSLESFHDFDLSDTLNPFDKRWLENYSILEEYVKVHGHLPTAVTSYNGVKIGSWLNGQRRKYIYGKLIPQRAEKLRAVGVTFLDKPRKEILEARWHKNYALCREFVVEHGRLPFQKEVYKEVGLGTWLNNQILAYRNGRLDPARQQLLEEINVPFGADRRDLHWEEMFELFKEYVFENSSFPKTYAVYKDISIGIWYQHQKATYTAGTLPAERARLLCEFGAPLSRIPQFFADDSWDSMYALLKEYVDNFKHLPHRLTFFKGVALGAWLNTEMIAVKQKIVSPERVKLLSDLGVKVNTKTRQERFYEDWQRNFGFCKEFMELYGRLPSYSKVYKGVKLGNWLASQKHKYRIGRLAPEHAALLREIVDEFKPKAMQQDGRLADLIGAAENSKDSACDCLSSDRSIMNCPEDPGDR